MSKLSSPSIVKVSGPRPTIRSTPSALRILSASNWWTKARPGIITACFTSLKSICSRSSFVIKQAISFGTPIIFTLSASILSNILLINGAAILDVIMVASPVTFLINCKNISFSSLAIANGPPVSGSHNGVPVTLKLYSLLISSTNWPNSSTGCDSIPLRIGSFPKINPSLKVFANLIKINPLAPHSSKVLQVCLSTSPSLTPGIITPAPVKSAFSQKIWQAFRASSGFLSFTHSLLSLGSVEKTVNVTSSTPLLINLEAISLSVMPFPQV